MESETKIIKERLYIRVFFAECNLPKKAQKLLKIYKNVVGANSPSAKIYHLNRMINFINDCNEHDIMFYLNKDAIDKAIVGSYREEFKEHLFDEKMDSNYISNEVIISLCKQYIKDIKEAKNDEKRNKVESKKERKKGNSTFNDTARHISTSSTTRPSLFVDDSSKKTHEVPVSNHDEINQTKIHDEIDTKKQFIDALDEDFKNYRYYISPDIIEPIIENDRIAEEYKKLIRKFYSYSPAEVLDFALNVYKILPTYLENRHNIMNGSSDMFFKEFNVEESLKSYEEIYEKYMRVYSIMPKKEKEKQNEECEKYLRKPSFESAFGKKDFSFPQGCMVTPDELREQINRKIIYDMSKLDNIELSTYFSNDNEKLAPAPPVLSDVTKYMNMDEVVQLYHTMKESKYPKNSNIKYDMDLVNKALNIFQRKFVKLIIEKFYYKEIKDLSDDELEGYINSKYSDICTMVLKEDPIDSFESAPKKM